MKKDIAEVVFQTVLDVARQNKPDLERVQGESALRNDLGFASLDLAQVVAELEIALGVDPFARTSASRVLTVKDLVALYEAEVAART